MFWHKYNYAALRPYSFKDQLAINLFYRWASKLGRKGFFNTPEGQYIRVRDFTPFFWRTLLARKDERIKFLKEQIEWLNMELKGDQATVAIVVAAIIKAAGGEVKVNHGLLYNRDHLVIEQDVLNDSTTYKVVAD
jgi:hypothetical protein